MPSGPFTLAGLAHAAGMNVEEIHSYQKQGLLQPARRNRRRDGGMAFYADHVERLKFIRRALLCGFTLEDIARLLDPEALVTCGDVTAITARRLEILRAEGKADAPEAMHLAKLLEICPTVGGRRDCSILETLSGPNCCGSN